MSNVAPIKRGRVVYFDCYSGISGDMTLGALLDCGAPLEEVTQLLQRLNLPGWRLQAKKVIRHGLSGTDLSVVVEKHDPVHRGLTDITGIINDSDLPRPIKDKSITIFKHLAEAEACVHGAAVEKIHFHEVGAVDALVDIVGSVSALHMLNINTVYCSPLPLGRGMVQSAHGLIPLPGPAVLQLIQKRGVPVYGVNEVWEQVTPTGVAIMTALADHFGPLPALTIESVGYGAGKFDPGYPNFLRALVGVPVSVTNAWEEPLLQIEANIDDLNPEIYGYLMEKLIEAGAMDVFFTPIQMKKNRPAVKLSLLSAPFSLDPLLGLIFNETSTLGVRIFEGRKKMRPRFVDTVQTEWGPVRIKIVPAEDEGFPQHVAPEYEDCRAIAVRTGLPLKEIYRMAEYTYRRR